MLHRLLYCVCIQITIGFASLYASSNNQDLIRQWQAREQSALDNQLTAQQQRKNWDEQRARRVQASQDTWTRLQNQSESRFQDIDDKATLLLNDKEERRLMPSAPMLPGKAVIFCEPRVQAECQTETCPLYCQALYATDSNADMKIQQCISSCPDNCSIRKQQIMGQGTYNQNTSDILQEQIGDMKAQCIAQARDPQGNQTGRRKIDWFNVLSPRFYKLLRLSDLKTDADNPTAVDSYSAKEGWGTNTDSDNAVPKAKLDSISQNEAPPSPQSSVDSNELKSAIAASIARRRAAATAH